MGFIDEYIKSGRGVRLDIYNNVSQPTSNLDKNNPISQLLQTNNLKTSTEQTVDNLQNYKKNILMNETTISKPTGQEMTYDEAVDKGLLYKWSDNTYREEKEPFSSKASSFGTGLATSLLGENFTYGMEKGDELRERASSSVGKTGEIVGDIATAIIPYTIANKVLKGTKLAKTITNPFIREVVFGQIADTIIQTPQVIGQGIVNKDNAETILKDVLQQQGTDLAMNIAFAGFEEIGKKVFNNFKNKKITKEQAETLIKEETQKRMNSVLSKFNDNNYNKNIAPTVDEMLSKPNLDNTIKSTDTPTEKALINNTDTKITGEVPKEQTFKLEETPTNTSNLVGNIDTKWQVMAPQTKTSTAKAIIEKISKPQEIFDNFYTKFVSSARPIEKLSKQLENQGINVNLKQKADFLNRISAQTKSIIDNGLTDLQGNKIGKSVKEIFSQIERPKAQDFQDYMLHKHNIDRANLNKGVFADVNGKEIDSAFSKQKALEYEKINPNFKQVGEDLRKFIDNLVEQYGLGTGQISEETLNSFRKLYSNYIPTYRKISKNIDGLPSGKNVFKKITSAKSDKSILPLDEQIVSFVDKIVTSGRKNQFYNTLYDIALKNPEAVSKDFKVLKTETKASDIEDILDGAETLTSDKNMKKLTLFRDGKKVEMQISEPVYEFLNAAKKSESALSKFADVTQKNITNPLKKIFTNFSPIFTVRQFLRDNPNALVNTINLKGYAKNYPLAIRDITTNADSFKTFIGLGGGEGFFSDGKSVVKFLGEKKNILKKTPELFENINKLNEMLPRYTEYKNTLDVLGDTPENRIIALYNAADITTNFARSGTYGRELNKIFMFINPAIQGIDKFARQLVNRPIQTIGKGLAVMTAPSLILDLMNSDNENYKNLSEREKSLYYNIPTEDGKFIKIPKSRENGMLFSTLYEWVARATRGEKLDTDKIGQILFDNTANFLNLRDSFVFQPYMNVINQLSKPDAEVLDYAGRPIVPARLRLLEKKYQFDEKSSEVSKVVGNALDVSPKVIDYFLKSTFGFLSQAVMPQNKNSNILETYFINDPLINNDVTDNFYKKKSEIDKQYYTFKELNPDVKNPYAKQRNEYTKASKKIGDLYDELRSYYNVKGKEERIKEIRQTIIDLAEGIK